MNTPQPSRRTVLRAGGLLAGGAAVAGALPARASATAAGQRDFTVLTAATNVAARTDRRPVAGGVYDRAARTTFISWGGRNEDSYVQAYDHRTGTFSAPNFVVGGRGDSHNYPTMVQADDGHLIIVVGMHNGETVVARSPRPHSVDGVWTSAVVPAGAASSYPMPFKTARGELFVFFRETTRTLDPTVPSDTRPLLYMRSRDNGRTWQSSKELTGAPFALGSTDRADNLNEIYMGQLRYDLGTHGPERVHLVWTLAGGGPDQHLHDFFHKDIHYATFDPNTLRFHDVRGTDLGTQLDDADQEQRCKVAVTPLTRPGGQRAPDYIQLVGTLLDGRWPFVMWFASDENLLLHNFASVWTGRGWRTTEVAAGLRTREMERLNPVTWRVYTTRDGQPNIETYLLTLGRFWRPETVIPTAKPVGRIELITNFRDPARILASGASSARDVAIADGDIHIAGL